MLPDVVLVRDGASGPLDDVSRLSIVDVGSTFFVLVVSEWWSDNVVSVGSSAVPDSLDVLVGVGDDDKVSADSSSVDDGVVLPWSDVPFDVVTPGSGSSLVRVGPT